MYSTIFLDYIYSIPYNANVLQLVSFSCPLLLFPHVCITLSCGVKFNSMWMP